jgi:F0F1-type ATP synthase assembly protein I
MKTSPWRIIAALGLAAAGVGILVLIVNNNNAGQRDFISYWAAGQQLVHGADPYDGAAVQSLERVAGYDLSYRLIMRNPPLALFLTLPLGFVSPNTGLILWLMALLASLVASIRMLWTMHGRQDNRLHLLGYCFAPLMECLMAGQLGIFLLLGVVLFLYFHKSRPFLAGAALLLCAVKPHLFLPFAIVLLLWVIVQKAYRILAGFSVALLASCTLVFCFDRHAWSQYSHMMSTSGIMDEIVPTLSEFFRLLVHRDAVWLQFLPQAAGCGWALWYFWTRRSRWSWMDQGLLLLLVSVLCAPYALLTDEAMLLPAVLAGIYRADDSGRSLLPFGFIAGVAMIEVFAEIPMTSVFYLWTVPAWLAWYLYATGNKGMRAKGACSGAAEIAESL